MSLNIRPAPNKWSQFTDDQIKAIVARHCDVDVSKLDRVKVSDIVNHLEYLNQRMKVEKHAQNNG